jgi:Rieske Fe-S protein
MAASRDASGTVTLLGAECTHLGCLVQWNVAGSTWDCPCHGSRFDREGAVLAGPATSPLARYAPGVRVVDEVPVPASRPRREANRDDTRRG